MPNMEPDSIARPSTPFGAGSFCFVINQGEIVQDLILETDFGVYVLDSPEPEAPDYPIWTSWALIRRKQTLSGKDFVYVPQQNLQAAIELWQKVRNNDHIILRKEDVRPLWVKVEELDDDQIRENWQNERQNFSQVPWDAQFMVNWAIGYVNIFGQKYTNDSPVSEADRLFKFRNEEVALTGIELAKLIDINTIFHF